MSKENRNNYDIFKFIKPNDNDQFSKMDNHSIDELLYYLDKYYLTLRDKLNFNETITFGLELEFDYAMERRIKKQLEDKMFINWKYMHEETIMNGGEITSPILTNNPKTWTDLRKICLIAKNNSIITPECGSHVHIGKQALGKNGNNWLNFIKLWSVYENIIFRFSYGEYLNARDDLLCFACPTSILFSKKIEQLKTTNNLSNEDVTNHFLNTKKDAISFISLETKNTIEFRCPNGTLNPVIWQNNVNLFTNLLLYSKNENYNNDIITKRKIENEEIYSNLYYYHNIYLEQALELCDLIFSNNLDKIYFLRQYLKSFETSLSYAPAKNFTRMHKKKYY